MKGLREKHETSIKLIDAISHFEKLKKLSEETINGNAKDYTYIVENYKHDIIIYSMCIERLRLRYNILNNIFH